MGVVINMWQNWFFKVRAYHYALIITHAPNNQWFIQKGVASLIKHDRVNSGKCHCGHHIYNSRWTPLLGETWNTSLELDNEHDKYAVSIVKSGELVGHVERSISKLSSGVATPAPPWRSQAWPD